MTIDQLKQIILSNRKQLAPLYESLSYAKVMRKHYVETNQLVNEFLWHNEVNALKKKIAKLVELQIALKSEVQDRLNWSRAIRAMQKTIPECESE